MDSEAESAVRRAINAINDRTIQVRAAELLEPSIVRHDLVQLFLDTQGTGAGSDFVGMIVASMPDIRFDIEEMFSSGDRVAVRLPVLKTPHFA
jgi:predicted ester cyclase